jgi:hypothetical protein
LVVAIAVSNAAKLDNTYLPPRGAQTSGGSGNFLQTPVSGSADYQSQNELGRGGKGFSQRTNAFNSGNDYNRGDLSQNGNDYNQGQSAQYNNANAFNGFEPKQERAQASFERNAAILRQDNQNDGESYNYAYETENGIYAEESGVATNGVQAQGAYSYTGDDGQVYSIR